MRAVLTISLVLAGWMGLSAAAPLAGSFQTLAVPFVDADLLEALPSDVAVISERGGLWVFQGGDELAATLYNAGAVLVLPARKKTCVDLG